jgi:diguanylate cyclase (GGDEF)-like protein/PAS domain S-box-containing protein
VNRLKSRLQATVYMKLVIVAGGLALLVALGEIVPSQLGLPFVLLVALTIAVNAFVNIRLPRSKSNLTISDFFIFVALLLFGGEAALLLAVVEVIISSSRITRKALTIAFNAAAIACSTSLTALALRMIFGGVTHLPYVGSPAAWAGAVLLMALTQYAVNSMLVATAGALRAAQPIWSTWKKYYLWTSVGYFSTALAAALIAKLYAVIGGYAFVTTLPIIAVVYFTYLTYLKNVEASVAQAEQAERHLREMAEKEAHFRSAFDHAPIGMGLVDFNGRWSRVNRSLCDIVGYSETELLSLGFAIITHPDDLKTFFNLYEDVVQARAAARQAEVRFIHKGGHEVWTQISISLIGDTRDASRHVIFQIQDITNRKQAEDKMLHDASHDALTGLPNRARFMEALTMALERAKRYDDKSFAVLFLDLDRFKVINDSIGHLFGDQLLVAVARRLQGCVRAVDTVARLGGDEFTILLDGLKNPADAIHVVERLQEQISQPYALGDYETFTSASIGIAFADRSYESAQTLLRDADTAMYQAKQRGKAQSVIFNEAMHAKAVNMLRIETDLRRALKRQEFALHYQPIYALATGELLGFEALLRWRHAERGFISPAEFIPVAEETRLILPLGEWVLREAGKQIRLWQHRFPRPQPLFVSVNLSGKQFAHGGLIEQIIELLSRGGVDPQTLKLEVTESVVMENVEFAARMLEQIRGLGVELSIDDFGTGYSSLSYLHRLPLDTLKIDRSFVSRLEDNDENAEIVHTIIELARNLHMGVVAEGIETREQLARLRSFGCQAGQGYLFSKPVDVQAAEQLIRQANTSPAELMQVGEYVNFEPLASPYPS